MLTIHRRGTFHAHRSSNQCVSTTQEKFDYIVRLTCSTFLDDNGYLIPHEVIDDIMQTGKYGTCEQMALSSVNDLRDGLLEFEHLELKKIVVRIKAHGLNPIAFIEAEWNA